MLTSAILDLKHKVAARIKRRLDRLIAEARVDEAGGEEIAGDRIFEANFGARFAGDDAETTGPDLIGLEPFAALVTAGGGARGDLEDGDLADDEESVLEGVVVEVVEGRRGGGRRRGRH